VLKTDRKRTYGCSEEKHKLLLQISLCDVCAGHQLQLKLDTVTSVIEHLCLAVTRHREQLSGRDDTYRTVQPGQHLTVIGRIMKNNNLSGHSVESNLTLIDSICDGMWQRDDCVMQRIL